MNKRPFLPCIRPEGHRFEPWKRPCKACGGFLHVCLACDRCRQCSRAPSQPSASVRVEDLNIAFAPAMRNGVSCIKRWYTDGTPQCEETVWHACGNDHLRMREDGDGRDGPEGERAVPCAPRRCPWSTRNDDDDDTWREPRYSLVDDPA